jgi:hypothetical protein
MKPRTFSVTVRARILAALAEGGTMRAADLMRATGAKKCRMHSELARAVTVGQVIRTGEPPNSEYALARRFCYDWGGRDAVNTGHLVADALANRSHLEMAWAKGRRRHA